MIGRAALPHIIRISAVAAIDVDHPDVRIITLPRRQRMGGLDELPSPLLLPEGGRPFHFTRHMGRLCADVASRIPDFAHIDIRQILVTFARSRAARSWGIQAKLVPLRFRGGRLVRSRNGRRFAIQRIFLGQTEIAYILAFYLPRFLNLDFFEKLVTVVHELYHISPHTLGDLRRFGQSGSRLHGTSRQRFDAHMGALARKYLSHGPDPAVVDFLRLSAPQLNSRYDKIVGLHAPMPRVMPLGP